MRQVHGGANFPVAYDGWIFGSDENPPYDGWGTDSVGSAHPHDVIDGPKDHVVLFSPIDVGVPDSAVDFHIGALNDEGEMVVAYIEESTRDIRIALGFMTSHESIHMLPWGTITCPDGMANRIIELYPLNFTEVVVFYEGGSSESETSGYVCNFALNVTWTFTGITDPTEFMEQWTSNYSINFHTKMWDDSDSGGSQYFFGGSWTWGGGSAGSSSYRAVILHRMDAANEWVTEVVRLYTAIGSYDPLHTTVSVHSGYDVIASYPASMSSIIRNKSTGEIFSAGYTNDITTVTGLTLGVSLGVGPIPDRAVSGWTSPVWQKDTTTYYPVLGTGIDSYFGISNHTDSAVIAAIVADGEKGWASTAWIYLYEDGSAVTATPMQNYGFGPSWAYSTPFDTGLSFDWARGCLNHRQTFQFLAVRQGNKHLLQIIGTGTVDTFAKGVAFINYYGTIHVWDRDDAFKYAGTQPHMYDLLLWGECNVIPQKLLRNQLLYMDSQGYYTSYSLESGVVAKSPGDGFNYWWDSTSNSFGRFVNDHDSFGYYSVDASNPADIYVDGDTWIVTDWEWSHYGSSGNDDPISGYFYRVTLNASGVLEIVEIYPHGSQSFDGRPVCVRRGPDGTLYALVYYEGDSEARLWSLNEETMEPIAKTVFDTSSSTIPEYGYHPLMYGFGIHPETGNVFFQSEIGLHEYSSTGTFLNSRYWADTTTWVVHEIPEDPNRPQFNRQMYWWNTGQSFASNGGMMYILFEDNYAYMVAEEMEDLFAGWSGGVFRMDLSVDPWVRSSATIQHRQAPNNYGYGTAGGVVFIEQAIPEFVSSLQAIRQRTVFERLIPEWPI